MEERTAGIPQRSERASRIITNYDGGRDMTPGIALSEVLCDLLLWSWREGIDFPEMLRRAIQVRDAESLAQALAEETE